MRTHFLIALVFSICPMLALAESQVPRTPDGNDSFVYHPAEDVYVYTYTGIEAGVPVTVRTVYVPSTRIVPSVKSRIAVTTSGGLRYSYRLKNGRASKQRLSSILFTGSHSDRFGVSTPAGWMEVIVPDNISPTEAPNAATQYRISWSYVEGGIAPGSYQDGFAFVSNDLPGIAQAQLEGYAVPYKGPLDSGTWAWPPNNAVQDKVYAFESTDFIKHLVAAPKIGNPVPFNAAVVLGNLQKHLKTDVVPLGSIDPVLFTVIDRGLTQAIAAAQAGNTPSLLHEIKSLRQLLKQEYADVDQDNDADDDDKQPKPRITKLAARVLDFNLGYVGLKMAVR